MVNFPFRKKQPVETSDNAVDAKKSVIDALIGRFKKLRFDDSAVVIKKVTIWASDPVDISLLKTDAFVNQVHTEIENNFISALANSEIVVKMGKPAAKVQAGCLLEDRIWYSFSIDADELTSSRKVAKITISGNLGSLKRKAYELDTDKRSVFHIGRGDHEKNKVRPYRENYIVINDEEKNKGLLELNSHVSGSHADIIFDEGTYYLRATPYGYRPDGSKTSIIRETKDGTVEYEIKDCESRFRLRDGDLIELGGTVVLEFILAKK